MEKSRHRGNPVYISHALNGGEYIEFLALITDVMDFPKPPMEWEPFTNFMVRN